MGVKANRMALYGWEEKMNCPYMTDIDIQTRESFHIYVSFLFGHLYHRKDKKQ